MFTVTIKELSVSVGAPIYHKATAINGSQFTEFVKNIVMDVINEIGDRFKQANEEQTPEEEEGHEIPHAEPEHAEQ